MIHNHIGNQCYSAMCPSCGRALISIFRPQNSCDRCGWRTEDRARQDRQDVLAQSKTVLTPDGRGRIVDPQVGRALRSRRRRLGMTQQQLADAIYLSLPGYKRIEQGAPFPLWRWEAITRALDEYERPGRDRSACRTRTGGHEITRSSGREAKIPA